MPKKKSNRRKKAVIRKTGKKSVSKATRVRKPARKQTTRKKRPVRGRPTTAAMNPMELKGLGSETGGQAGDIQGLTRFADVDSESVEELAEEGQAFEAGIVSGVANAPDADESEVTAREVPEDDVPSEYAEKD